MVIATRSGSGGEGEGDLIKGRAAVALAVLNRRLPADIFFLLRALPSPSQPVFIITEL